MPRFVIEVSNPDRNAPAFVHPGELVPVTTLDAHGDRVPVFREGQPVMQVQVQATGLLVLDPSGPRETSRIALTSEQFRQFSYDLEGKSEGKYGCDRSIELHAANADTGERMRISYAEAAELVAQSVTDDAAAIADQKKKAAEWAAACDDRTAEEKESDAADEANSVAASMNG